jgi:hypothetical protein
MPDLTKARLASQQIAGTELRTVKAVVGWMGAMQAQDYPMAKWAIGVRLSGATEKDVEAAIAAGEIVRLHLLRPTWHFVAAEDVHWLRELTAPGIRASLRFRHRELGLSADIIAKSHTAIEKALSGGSDSTREELVTALHQTGIAVDGNRASHLLMLAELDGIICSGAAKGTRPTYALMAERVPKPKPLSREEALARLAKRYFDSRGPATLQDFTWWSGLSAADAKRSLALVQADLTSETVASRTYWFSGVARSSRTPSVRTFRTRETEVRLLPAYDEYLIGYRERTAALSAENHGKAVSNNGLFKPVVTVGGQIAGTWKREADRDGISVEIALFKKAGRSMTQMLAKASARYGGFLGKEVNAVTISQRLPDWQSASGGDRQKEVPAARAV